MPFSALAILTLFSKHEVCGNRYFPSKNGIFGDMSLTPFWLKILFGGTYWENFPSDGDVVRLIEKIF